MSKSYTGGLNFTWPVKKDTNWDGIVDAALTGVSGHTHAGGGAGAQLTSAAFANDTIPGTKIRLANAEYLRARNATNTGDLNLLRADSSNLLDLATAARFSSTETLTASGAISIVTSLTILNGATLAMTLANGAEGQVKWVVNISGTSATITPGTTAGPNEVKLYTNGSVMYLFLSGEWRFVRGNPQGTTTNDSATAGDVGETKTISRLRSVAPALTTGTALNVTAVQNMTLTPGDWDVRGMVGFQTGATTSVTFLEGAVSNTSATLPGSDTFAVPSATGEIRAAWTQAASVPNGDLVMNIAPYRVSVSSNTNLYLVARANFTVSTMATYGFLEARRIR